MPGGSNRALFPPVSYPTATNTSNIVYKNNHCLKSLLQLININASKLLSVKRRVSGFNFRPATLKYRLLVISKFVTISSNCGLRSSASQHSIAQLLIWNEMNSDANIAAHLSIKRKVNGQQSLTGFAEFFYQYLVDHGWHASYQCCGKVLSTWIKVLYSSENKVFLLYINYCTNYIHGLLQHLHS